MTSPPTRKRYFVLEDVLILLCILVLWPTVFGWEGTVFRILQWTAVACLIVILVRRIRRIANKRTSQVGG